MKIFSLKMYQNNKNLTKFKKKKTLKIYSQELNKKPAFVFLNVISRRRKKNKNTIKN